MAAILHNISSTTSAGTAFSLLNDELHFDECQPLSKYSTLKCLKIATRISPALCQALNENSFKVDEWNTTRQRRSAPDCMCMLAARLKRTYSTKSFRVAACAFFYADQKDKDLIMMQVMNKLSNWQAWGLYYEVKHALTIASHADFPHPIFPIHGRLPSGNTVLHEVMTGLGSPGLMDFLINAGASVQSRNKRGETPLHLAVNAVVYKEVRRLISTLISAGADINARDNQGRTPLHHAMARPTLLGAREVVSQLLAYGANVLTTDNDGETALDLANRKPSTEIATLLRQARLASDIAVAPIKEERRRL